MRYTKYFSQLIRSHGTPQLSQDNMSTFLNIIHLEAKVKVYDKLNEKHKYSINVARLKEIVTQLTNDLEPKELIRRWTTGESIKTKPFKEEDTPWDDHDPMFETKRRNLEYKSR